MAYLEANPVTAGLALNAEDWPWSSASQNTGGKTARAPGQLRNDIQELESRRGVSRVLTLRHND